MKTLQLNEHDGEVNLQTAAWVVYALLGTRGALFPLRVSTTVMSVILWLPIDLHHVQNSKVFMQ